MSCCCWGVGWSGQQAAMVCSRLQVLRPSSALPRGQSGRSSSSKKERLGWTGVSLQTGLWQSGAELFSLNEFSINKMALSDYGFLYDSAFSLEEMRLCAQEIPDFIHRIANFVSLPLAAVLFYYTKPPQLQFYNKYPKLYSSVGFAVLAFGVVQVVHRLFIRQLLSVFNPCHFSLLLLGVLLLMEDSPLARKLLVCFQSMSYGVILALVFPDYTGLGHLGEVLFVFEHLLSWPLGFYLLQSKWQPPSVLSIYVHYSGFSGVVLYQRLIGLIAQATFFNLNSTLCHSPADPLQGYFGPYYLLAAEHYLSICSYLVKIVLRGPSRLKSMLVR